MINNYTFYLNNIIIFTNNFCDSKNLSFKYYLDYLH